jgi:hypothetical protein
MKFNCLPTAASVQDYCSFFFFFNKYIQKAQRGATHSTHDVYMKPLIQRKKEHLSINSK